MNRADLWLGNTPPLSGGGNIEAGNTELRGMDTVRTIKANPIWIVISRFDPVQGKTIQLAPQLVRVDILQNPRESNELRDAIVAISKQYVVMIGVKDNPFMPNTDAERADQFFFDNQNWSIAEFLPTVPGRLLASLMLTP